MAPLRTGDVVILVPDRKLSELLTNPVIEPSAFWTHFERTGILSFTGAFFTGAFFTGAFLTGAAFLEAAGFDLVLDPAPKNEKLPEAFFGSGVGSGVGSGFALPPKRESVERALGFGGAGAAGLAATGFFAAGLGDPNKEKAGFAFFGSGVGSSTGSGFALDPNNERVGRVVLGFEGAGALATTAFLAIGFFAAGFDALKKVWAGFLAGAGVGAGAAAFFAAGELPKNEKVGAGAFLTGAGAGAAAFLGAGLLPKNEKAGAGAFFTILAGAGAAAFFGAGLLNLNIAGAGAFLAGAGAGAGAF